MRALVYTAPCHVEIQHWPRHEPSTDVIEIAVEAAGICGADISGFLGRSRRRKPPLIFGHELVGRTLDGLRVVADPLIGCGQCAPCLNGAKNLCPNLRLLGMDQLPGCFADYVSIPQSHVHPIPDHLADSGAILAEPLANIVHLFRLAAPQPHFRMGIVGAGLMGSLALQMALHLGAAEVLVEDVIDARLAAAQQMGATLAVNPRSQPNQACTFAGHGLDLVLDACGEASARQHALDLCRPGATVVLLGMAIERSDLDFGAAIRRELRVQMSFGYTAEDFTHSLDLLTAGEIDLTQWTAEMPLEEGQKAFEQMTGSPGDTLKMLLRVR